MVRDNHNCAAVSGDAHFLNHIFFLDSCAKNIGMIDFDEFFHFVVADIINNQGSFLHIYHHSFVIKGNTLFAQRLPLFIGYAG